MPADFSPGTDGPVRGEVVFAPLWEHPEDEPSNGDLVRVAERIETWKAQNSGRLAGKIVMLEHPNPWKLPVLISFRIPYCRITSYNVCYTKLLRNW